LRATFTALTLRAAVAGFARLSGFAVEPTKTLLAALAGLALDAYARRSWFAFLAALTRIAFDRETGIAALTFLALLALLATFAMLTALASVALEAQTGWPLFTLLALFALLTARTGKADARGAIGTVPPVLAVLAGGTLKASRTGIAWSAVRTGRTGFAGFALFAALALFAFVAFSAGRPILDQRESRAQFLILPGTQREDLGTQIGNELLCLGIARAIFRIAQFKLAPPLVAQFRDDEAAGARQHVRKDLLAVRQNVGRI
jgi:hypothetical protein